MMIRMTRAAGWLRRSATIAISASAIAAGIGITAMSSMAAAEANPAAGAAKVHVGTYRSWKAAQHAAGFRLLRPAGTDGLKPSNGGIRVAGCEGNSHKYANVYAQYGYAGYPSRKLIGLFQDDAPGATPCENIGIATPLGHYKVDGTTATLLGACGTQVPGLPSCHHYHVWLFLVWTRHGHYYQVQTHDESRSTIVAFARRLHKVS
jgi:hypothetical protein